MMTASKEGDSRYMAFLLRMWQEGHLGEWRITLENPHSGERHAFHSLALLFAFLEERTAHQPPPPANHEQQ